MSITKYIYLKPEWQKANITDINEEIKQTLDFFLYLRLLSLFESWLARFGANFSQVTYRLFQAMKMFMFLK